MSQLTAIEMPGNTLNFGYDPAGRLRALTGSLNPQHTQRWNIDNAGNRLPGKQTTQQEQKDDWAKLVHQRWQDPSFNLLGEGSTPANQQGPIDQWSDNRIGFDDNHAWRYSSQGNRVEQATQHPNGQYSLQRLSYDGSNQLTAVQLDATNNQGHLVKQSESRYVHDALGRRLQKTVTDPQGNQQITYFGWDGDRQVHTEHVKDDGSRAITHTIYEPGAFTPMVRLSATARSPESQADPLARAMQAALPVQHEQQAMSMMHDMLKAIPQEQQKLITNALHKMLQPGQTMHPALAMQSPELIENLRKGLEESKEEPNPIEVHFYHCDHLGTPLALTDQNGQIVWAAKLDPWGNIQEEFNPNGIEQNIRLPGQHHDRETGLYYNRHRYYDPKIGSYINQDPIGLRGGMHLYSYTSNPIQSIDPLGLWAAAVHTQIMGTYAQRVGLKPEELDAMIRGSSYADNSEFQTPEYSYRHAMSSNKLTKRQACEQANKFLDDNLSKTDSFQKGIAFHLIQDSESPPHKDFAKWTPNWHGLTHHGYSSDSVNGEGEISQEKINEIVDKMIAFQNGKRFDCACYL